MRIDLGKSMSKIFLTLLMSATLTALACGGGKAQVPSQPTIDATTVTAPSNAATLGEERVL
jgi:hypothetical protein